MSDSSNPSQPAPSDPADSAESQDIQALLDQAVSLAQTAATEIGSPPLTPRAAPLDLERPPIGSTHVDDQMDEVAALVEQAGKDTGAFEPSAVVPIEPQAAGPARYGSSDEQLAEIIDQAAQAQAVALAVEEAVETAVAEAVAAPVVEPATEPLKNPAVESPATQPDEEPAAESPTLQSTAAAEVDTDALQPPVEPVDASESIAAQPVAAPTGESTATPAVETPADAPAVVASPRPSRFRAVAKLVARPLSLLNLPFRNFSGESRSIAGWLGIITLLSAAALWMLPRLLKTGQH